MIHEIDSDEENRENIEDYIIEKIKLNSNQEMGRFNVYGIHSIDTWELQRKLINNHVNEICDEISKIYKKTGQVFFTSPIVVAYYDIEENRTYRLIDGQHRLNAYFKFAQKTGINPFYIPITIVKVENEEDFLYWFNIVNKNTPIEWKDLDLDKTEPFLRRFDEEFGRLFPKKTCFGKNRPFIKKDLLVEKIRSSRILQQKSIEYVISKIKEKNKEEIVRRKDVSEKMYESAKKYNFLLGVYKDISWFDSLFVKIVPPGGIEI